MTGLIDLNILPLETLAEMANEAGEQAEKNAKITVLKAIDAGRYLVAAREQVEQEHGHGHWLAWLGKNWNYSQPTASRYITLASNLFTMNNLADAKSVNEALRMIAAEKAESEPATAQRAERKTGQVEVVEPGQTDVQADESDDDPAPEPPTTRKTAKGSEKTKESDKPKTQPITPEILDEPDEEKGEFFYATFSECVEVAVSKVAGADVKVVKAAAKIFRKSADTLDPPTKFVKPTIEDVTEYCERRKNSVDPEKFLSYYAANGWKLSNGNKMADWQAAVVTWEQRENNGTMKKDVARIRKRQAKEIVYDE